MSDDWDDWEDEEFIIPTINILTKEQLKRIEERKLIEENDTELAKELFSDASTNQQKFDIQQKNDIQQKINIQNHNKLEKKIKNKNKQIDNVLKQKENSKKIIEAKLKKQREIELYGEPEEIYEYDEYDNLYHL
jgi:hypothetical protein